MIRGLLRFGVVAILPTAADVGLLAALYLELDWSLAGADTAALVVASTASWLLHRNVTFGADPYIRWVRYPNRFGVVALIAGAVDVAVLVSVHPGGDAVDDLLWAKLVALAAAALVRLVLYRAVLLGVVRRTMQARRDGSPPPGALRASVIVPALDEAERIGPTVSRLREALAELDDPDGAADTEVVVVDDGSTDGTADAALAAGADQVITLPANRGKGAAVRAGMLAARGRTVAFTDADLAYDPAQVVAAILRVEQGWDVVVGNRRHPDAGATGFATRARAFGSQAVNLLTSVVLLSRPHDTQCGLKAFRSDAARFVFGQSRIDGFAFDIEVFHLVERHELALTELPVTVAQPDRSTVSAARDGLRLLRDLWRIRRFAASGAYDRAPDATRHRAPGAPSHGPI